MHLDADASCEAKLLNVYGIRCDSVVRRISELVLHCMKVGKMESLTAGSAFWSFSAVSPAADGTHGIEASLLTGC